MEVDGKLIMGYRESQEMNPCRETEHKKVRRMGREQQDKERRECRQIRMDCAGNRGRLLHCLFSSHPLLDDQYSDSQASRRTPSSSNESHSQLNTLLCFTASAEGPATMKKLLGSPPITNTTTNRGSQMRFSCSKSSI